MLKIVQQIFGNIFLDKPWKIFFSLDDVVPGTRWPEAKKSALTTPKDRTTVKSMEFSAALSAVVTKISK